MASVPASPVGVGVLQIQAHSITVVGRVGALGLGEERLEARYHEEEVDAVGDAFLEEVDVLDQAAPLDVLRELGGRAATSARQHEHTAYAPRTTFK